ncbi:MAG: ATP-dependent DNA helicase RecG [Gammaproteobacteria bacterium]|nr:ATP-dependent DNA helicase RecG [Gammaproteobacteria bacterium]
MAGNPLTEPIERLTGVGPRTAERLRRLRIKTIGDLLFHLPSRYQDRTQVTPIGTVRAGNEAVIEGTIELTQIKHGRRRSLLVQVDDGTGSLLLRFFHFAALQQRQLITGARIRCFGEARYGPQALELVHPEYEILAADAVRGASATLTPIYPSTEGLHQGLLRKLTEAALVTMAADLTLRDDPLDRLLAVAHHDADPLPMLATALRYVHRPPADADTRLLGERRHPTQQRLCLDELLAHHLSLRRVRAAVKQESAPAIAVDDTLRDRLLAGLPFALTRAQRRALAEIDADLMQPRPMLRLLQGDVGSGKTIVAAAVAARVLAAGRSVALMAPTELLAEQHYATLSRWFAPLARAVVLLAGKVPAKQRAEALAALNAGGGIAVGTHVLFQGEAAYRGLGLVIIDEQHRFGVDQRLALRDKGRGVDGLPHQLIMTATPIPRSLAMTAYADLDLSVIDELPPGRTPVNTAIVPDARRDEVVARIAHAGRAGRQIYWVCPLVEESELIDCQAASVTATQLAEALPELRIGLVHGQMKASDKERVMQDFAGHRLDLLVATTVIEVGVDVPNASLMIIDNAERLGLSQLHQLRGRVGRGATSSDCVLLYRPPLSLMARERLRIMRETNDGFVIAQRDLELRGPGELLGTRQTGVAEYRIADLATDGGLLPLVAALGRQLDADRAAGDRIIKRWLGGVLDYGSV